MDVVSDAISAVRIGRPSSDRVRISGRWCARFAPYEGAGFHVVLQGGCWLLPDGGAPVALAAGDAVLLPHGAGHVIADGPADAEAVARAVPFEEAVARRRGREMDLGSGPGDGPGPVEMLCGKYRLDRSRTHPLMAELPRSCTCRTGSAPTPNCGPPSTFWGGRWTSGGPARASRCPACSTCSWST